MKIFEVKEYIDGGPNDRGVLIGYVKASTREIANSKVNKSKSWPKGVYEISEEEYYKRKKSAQKIMNLYIY